MCSEVGSWSARRSAVGPEIGGLLGGRRSVQRSAVCCDQRRFGARYQRCSGGRSARRSAQRSAVGSEVGSEVGSRLRGRRFIGFTWSDL